MLRPASLPVAMLGEQGICHLSKQPPCTWPHTRITHAELTTQTESSDIGVCAASDLGHAKPLMWWRGSPERRQVAGLPGDRKPCPGSRSKAEAVHPCAKSEESCRERMQNYTHLAHIAILRSQVYRHQDLQLFSVHPIGCTRRIAA